MGLDALVNTLNEIKWIYGVAQAAVRFVVANVRKKI